MSGLGVAASVIAVVEVSAKVALLCARYSREVANSKTDATRLQGQTDLLRNALGEVDKLLNSQYGARLEASHKLRDGVTACLEQMRAMEKKMKMGKGHKAMSRLGLRALSWPFTRKEVDKIIEELKVIEATITLALQVDTVYVTCPHCRLLLILDALICIVIARLFKRSIWPLHWRNCLPRKVQPSIPSVINTTRDAITIPGSNSSET